MPLDHVIDFPTTVSSLAPVPALAKTDRIAAKVAMSVSFLPNLAELSLGHVLADIIRTSVTT